MTDIKLLLFTLFIICAGCSSSTFQTEAENKPEIINVFTCSDYCPGPVESYYKDAYKGVVDADECLKLDGEPIEVAGWGRTFFCLVN